jgi:hypothetical protein
MIAVFVQRRDGRIAVHDEVDRFLQVDPFKYPAADISISDSSEQSFVHVNYQRDL